MTSIYECRPNQRVSFEVYPTTVIGNNFRDVRLEGILSAQSATETGLDIRALHMAVYPSLPQGTPNNPFSYDWIKIQHVNGSYETIGIPWIRPDSVTLSVGGRITLVFEDKTQQDLERIQSALSANGYRPDDVRVDEGD